MKGPRLASDASPYLFSLYAALRQGWEPPTEVSEELYQILKQTKDPSNPLTAFVGYGCSFGGVFFSNPARGEDRNYAQEARNSLLKKFSRCQEVTFAHCSYERLTPGASLVYCDPPYANTTGYSAVGAFDHVAFWEKCRQWTRDGATVLVSEYTAPEDFKVVWSIETKTDMHGEGRKGRTEKLFEWAGA
jgi:DNA adenine methylase